MSASSKSVLKPRVSVIIPARKEGFLQQTLEEIYSAAAGSIEVFVVLDGWQPDFELAERPGLRILRNDNVRGMRASINTAAEQAKGKYLMKIDAHCMIGEGWDDILSADCEDNWIVVPRRYWLDAPTWKTLDLPYVDAMVYLYPFKTVYQPRLTCRPWEKRQIERQEALIDEDMGFQGSCWFMTLQHFNRLGGMSETGYGTFAEEPQELGLKTQLGPWEGRVMRNKKIWYAHWSKPSLHWRTAPEIAGRVSDEERKAGYWFSFDYWWNNRWDKRAHDFEWLIERFWPLPEWPENWSWLTQQYTRYPEVVCRTF